MKAAQEKYDIPDKYMGVLNSLFQSYMVEVCQGTFDGSGVLGVVCRREAVANSFPLQELSFATTRKAKAINISLRSRSTRAATTSSTMRR